jgi:hypothetical protein
VLTALVVVETLVLALLAVIVVALLRSHAEILRRLPEPDRDTDDTPAVGGPVVLPDTPQIPQHLPQHLPSPRRRPTEAHDIAGSTLEADPVVVTMRSGADTVLAFLSTGCLTCRTFWDGLRAEVRRPLPGDARLVVVVKDPAFESPSKLRELAPPEVRDAVTIVQSSAAWEDFGVAMSPYFCFVDGRTGEVRSEGSAMSWEQVASLLRDALLDEEVAARG